MIAENNKELHEADKLFKKLIAPSLGSSRLDSHIHQLHAPMKIGPVLLPHRSNSHGTARSSKASHNVIRGVRTPPATDLMLDDSFPRIAGDQATSSAVEYEESFVHSYQATSGVNIRRQQPRAGTSMSLASSTTKMKQLPLPQVQSSELLRISSPCPRGKRNVSVSSDRYLGTSRVGGGQPHHRRSKSAAEILHPMSISASSSDQVRRFKEERIALLQTRTLKRTMELMTHRRDRKYHMCGSGVPIHDRYMVDSAEMDQLRQLIHARATKRGSSPVNYYGRYGVGVTSGIGTRQTKLTSASAEQEQPQGNNIGSTLITIETNGNENSAVIVEETPTAVIDNGSNGKYGDSVAGDQKRKDGDEQDQMVEVMTTNVVDIAKTDSQEEREELCTMNERLDTHQDGEPQVSSSKSLDADQPVAGAIATAIDNAKESPEAELEEDGVTPADGHQNKEDGVTPADGHQNKEDGVTPADGHQNKEDGVTPADGHQNKEDGVTPADGHQNKEDGVTPADGHQNKEDGNGDQSATAPAEERTILDEGDYEERIGSEEAEVNDGADKDSDSDDMEIREIQNMMPNVRISRTQKKKNAKDTFMTEFETSEGTDDDIQEMFGNFKSTPRATGLSVDASLEVATQEDPSLGTPGEPTPLTAEEALLSMIISDDKIAAMEDGLKKIDHLRGGMKNVGHLEESELNLDELNAANPDVDYEGEMFGKVLNDEELKEIERLRAEKREARSVKARKADDSIVATAKGSRAKSKMADIYSFISPRQQEVFEKKFQELDIDGNGIITLQELFKRMYRGRDNKETGRAFMQVFDLNKDQTIDEREFVLVAALNDKLTGKLTDSADAPLELDLEQLGQNITAYKEIFQVTDQDADGRLTLEDVMLVISLSGNLERGVDLDIVQHVHDTIDADDNGTIDFMEYLTYIPFFLKLHKRMAESRHITIAEVEDARSAVRKAVLKVKGSKDVTMTSF